MSDSNAMHPCASSGTDDCGAMSEEQKKLTECGGIAENPEKNSDFGSENDDFRPKNADSRSQNGDSRPENAESCSQNGESRPEGCDSRPENAESCSETGDFQTKSGETRGDGEERPKPPEAAPPAMTKQAFLRLGFIALGLLCAALAVLNLIFSDIATARWDLTADKQFTLSPSTQALLGNLDAKIAVKVFLSPDLPAPDNALAQRAKDLLSEFEASSLGKLSFEIVSPQNATDEEVAKGFGVRKVAVSQRGENGRSLRLAFKGMTVIYRDRAETVPELRATDNLEYLIAKSIVNLTAPEKKTVAILTDFGGLAQSPILVDSMREVFAEVFGERVGVAGAQIGDDCRLAVQKSPAPDAGAQDDAAMLTPDALVLLNIDKPLTPCARYAIEQAVMRGASLAVLQSPSYGDYRQPDQPRINRDAGIDALLRPVGISLPPTLLLDRAHNLTGTQFTEDSAVEVSLPALPIIADLDKTHPITQNLTAIVLPFSGTIDIDSGKVPPEARLSVLAKSDADAVTRPSGGDIEVSSLQKARSDETHGPHVVAAAIETPYRSQFEGAIPDGANAGDFVASVRNARFFVVSDGEFLFTNKITGYSDAFAKLGIHMFVNAAEWLIQDEALMKIRNRALPQMIQKPDADTQNRIIRINVIGVPLCVIALMALLRLRRKYRVGRIKARYANAQSGKTQS